MNSEIDSVDMNKTDAKQSESSTRIVMIGTPSYDGKISAWHASAIVETCKIGIVNNINILPIYMSYDALVQRARNDIVKLAIDNNVDDLVFIDSDIGFNPHDVIKMIKSDVDMIGGIYPKKEINWDGVKRAMDQGVPNESLQYYTGSFVVNLVGYAGEVTVPFHEPCEIYNAGTGFLLIKREVFDKLSEHVPTYKNDVKDLGNT